MLIAGDRWPTMPILASSWNFGIWRRKLHRHGADETWLSSRAQRGICLSTKSRSLVATLLGMTIALCPASSAFKQFQACSNTETSALVAALLGMTFCSLPNASTYVMRS